MPLVKNHTRQAAASGMTKRSLSSMGHIELRFWVRSADVLAFRDQVLKEDVPINVAFHVHPDVETQLDPLQEVPNSECLSSPAALENCENTDSLLNVVGEPFAVYVRCGSHQTSISGERKNLPFEIELASTGEVIKVESDQTAIEALREHEVVIPTFCERGRCGTCITRILDGSPEHRDVFMNDQEHASNDRFTPCCSRARGRIVIDV